MKEACGPVGLLLCRVRWAGQRPRPRLCGSPPGLGLILEWCDVNKEAAFCLPAPNHIGGVVFLFVVCLFSSFILCFVLTDTLHILGFSYNQVHYESFRSLLLLTVDEIGDFYQVRNCRLIGVFYDHPAGLGGADAPIL